MTEWGLPDRSVGMDSMLISVWYIQGKRTGLDEFAWPLKFALRTAADLLALEYLSLFREWRV